MFRVTKSLNHNAVLALKEHSRQEYLLLGKGIGFGKKVSEYVEPGDDVRIYSLQSDSEWGDERRMVRDINPLYLEVADRILDQAEKEFGEIDRNILFSMADHIAFAAVRIKNGESISNPLTQDIQVLFYKEYKVAFLAQKLLKETDGILVDEDEIGYIALHVHSAICEEKVSSAMQIAGAVRECISMIETELGNHIDVRSLSYNRLMNHIKYMAARALSGEQLKADMNEYIANQFPKSFQIAETVCNELSKNLHVMIPDIEIGYLAMHIERVWTDETK